MSVGDDIAELLQQQLKEAGVDLKKSTAEVAAYANERVAHLKRSVGQAGYAKAAKAEARSIAMFGLEGGIDNADAADERTWDALFGALFMAAKILA